MTELKCTESVVDRGGRGWSHEHGIPAVSMVRTGDGHWRPRCKLHVTLSKKHYPNTVEVREITEADLSATARAAAERQAAREREVREHADRVWPTAWRKPEGLAILGPVKSYFGNTRYYVAAPEKLARVEAGDEYVSGVAFIEVRHPEDDGYGRLRPGTIEGVTNGSVKESAEWARKLTEAQMLAVETLEQLNAEAHATNVRNGHSEP